MFSLHEAWPRSSEPSDPPCPEVAGVLDSGTLKLRGSVAIEGRNWLESCEMFEEVEMLEMLEVPRLEDGAALYNPTEARSGTRGTLYAGLALFCAGLNDFPCMEIRAEMDSPIPKTREPISSTAFADGKSEGILDSGRSLELDLTSLVFPWESGSLPG